MYAWITPDEASEDTRLIEIRVPDDMHLYACLIGAILLLRDASNWQQIGTLTPDQCANLFAPTLDDIIANA